MRMDDVGAAACAFFLKVTAGSLGELCVTAGQLFYLLFNWADNRLRRFHHA